ncbi:GNAT family N-acetyltransferase [Aliicoccus persicus]|uniref:Acetyltransferase (GNAT) family protein n=1 Tax=Aliicoccus persicus TaxID=930138 RepID=A0A662Z3N2_9STAP|nr:GNAT family N-acetyltransferase [Aliicoccus persicus]SEV93918.1 Acetyltransferase (GNAT) family protein [Aliicoccus persicus]
MNFVKGYPIDKLVDYIAELSNENKHRIEYMDNHPDSIRFEIEHIAIDNPEIETVYVAEEDGEIECLFIFDASGAHTEVIGPFTKGYDIAMMQKLFAFALGHLIAHMKYLEFAINGDNAVALLFVEEIGAVLYEENYVLVLPRESYKMNDAPQVSVMEEHELDSVEQLFGRVFPDYRFNYYPETDVEEHLVQVTHNDENNVIGFIHTVVKEEFNDGLISYLGVDERARNQGLGSELMNAGLKIIFQHDDITEAYLRIDVNDMITEKFYENFGFETSIHTKIYRLKLI